MMPDSESILEAYLEGDASRAAAEGLRFRIALPFAAHAEAVLRLADCLTLATRKTNPPASAANRLRQQLGRAGAPDSLPNWVQDGGEFMAPPGARRADADEYAANAIIEFADPDTVAASSPEETVEVFQRLAASVRAATPASAPPGALDRLGTKLAAAFRAGEADPAIARRILSQLRGKPARPPLTMRLPDVLAAGEEPEDSDNSQ